MPYRSKITTDKERLQVEQAKSQHYLADADGRFTTSPVGLEYLRWAEQENIPYIIVRKRGKWCDAYIDLPGRYKFTIAGYCSLFRFFAEQREMITNKNCAYRVTADNAQFQGLPRSYLDTFIERTFAITNEQRSLQPIEQKMLRKLQRQNCIPEEGDYW